MRLVEALRSVCDFFVFVAKTWWNFPHGRKLEDI